MNATAITDTGRFELREPEAPAEWDAYHSIRERAVWGPLGIDKVFGPYDREFPDQFQANYAPLILTRNRIVVATMGVQDMGDGVLQFRAVGVDPACQRSGYGSIMLAMAEDRSRRDGFRLVWLYADKGAVMFYAHNAYTHGAAQGLNVPQRPGLDETVMAKRLSHGMRRPIADMLIAAA